jgi:hypothetical protein
MKVRSFYTGGSKSVRTSFLDLDAVDDQGELVLLWPTPLYVCHHDPKSSAWHGELRAEVARRFDDGRAFQGEWHVADFFRWDAPGTRGFKDHLKSHVAARIKFDLGSKVDRVTWGWNGWVNVKSGLSSHHPHIHERSTLSFIYYLETPRDVSQDEAVANAERGEMCGGLVQFLDPRGAAPYMSCETIDNVFASTLRVIPREGLLLILPSFLAHLVAPVTSNERRISIAGNIFNIKIA